MPHYGSDLKFIEVNRNIPLGFNEYSIGPMCETESTKDSISVVDRNPAWIILFFILRKLMHCLSIEPIQLYILHPAFFTCRCINPTLTASTSTLVHKPLPPAYFNGAFLHLSSLTYLKSSGVLDFPGSWSPRTSPVFVSALSGELFESTVHKTDGTGLASLGQFPKDAVENSSILLAGITGSHWRIITPTVTQRGLLSTVSALMDNRHWTILPISVVILCTG